MSRKKKDAGALVQIQPLPIPPLHQSTELVMSCQLFYVESIIKGRKRPGGLESARGNQVHKVHADYDAWCATKGVEMDLDAFDQFAKGVGPTATKILLGMRETHRVDFKHLLATELQMALDENFNPTELAPVLEGVIEDSGNPPHYQGTLDALFLFKENNKAAIHDAKTHPRPYDPSDPEKALQGKMYSLFVFLHFPWVEEITFKLIFVRFRDLVKEVVYKRSDLPSLIESVRAQRELQKALHAIHAVKGEMQATPGAHCFSGDTRFLTNKGVRTLKEACGQEVEILNRYGIWERAAIRSFGNQRLMRITFDDGSVVRSTREHRWWKMKRDPRSEGWVQTDDRITTMELDKVPIVKVADVPDIDREGIRHGFVYGDGYHRAGRNSCIALIHRPKDEHMLDYFPGASEDKGRNRYKKGGLPGHFKTLDGIESPAYARGFVAGILAADGSVCQNGGVHLYCEGKQKAADLAEIIRFAACVVSSVSLHSDKPTNYSPTGTKHRELMRIDIKPSTAPVIAPNHRKRLKTKSQMRRMYRNVVSIEEDTIEEVFCAVVPGSESFTLANGIVTSNCQYCPLLSDRSCPIGQLNENMQLSDEDRLRFKIWDAAFGRINTKVLSDRVNASGKNIVVKDYNGKSYTFGPEASTAQLLPLFQASANGIAMDREGNPVMPIVSLLLDYVHMSPEDTEWIAKIMISSSSIATPLKAKKRVHIHQAIQDVAEKITKVRLKVSKPLDTVPDEEPEEDENDVGEEIEF